MKKTIGMIEVDSVTIFIAQLAAFKNKIMMQFNKLSMNQPEAQVNTIHQGQTWCEIYRGSGHSIELCGANVDFLNFMGNEQK